MIKQTLFLSASILMMALFNRCGSGGTSENTGNDTTFLDSGVKYVMLSKGDGTPVTEGMEVTTHINLMINGVQDTAWSTYWEGQEKFTFFAKKTSLIQGFDEVVMYAKEGDRLLAIIPPELGYGQRGSGPDIPPNSTLFFDLDFLRVAKPKAFASDSMFSAWKTGGVENLIVTYERIQLDTAVYKVDDEEWYRLSISLAENKAFEDIVKMWDYRLEDQYLLGGYYYKARAYDSLQQINQAIATLETAIALDTTNNPSLERYLQQLKSR